MTGDKIDLRELLEKGFGSTFLREMIGFAAQRLMEPEMEGLWRAGQAQRRPAEPSEMATATGRRGQVPRSCGSASAERIPDSWRLWSHAGQPRRR